MTSNRTQLTMRALQNTPFILFVLIFVLFGLLSPKFFAPQNLLNIIKQASYIGILAVGITFVLLTAGIDLSIGANMYLSAVVAGTLIQNYGVPVWLAFIACLVVGMLFGAFNALFITKLKIIPFVVTLATLVAGRGLALLITRSQAVSFPDSVVRIGSTTLLGIPMPIVIFGIVVFLAMVFLNLTPTGRHIYAVGQNEESAKKAGLKNGRILAIVYIICGLLAALGGFISVAQLGIINAGFGEGIEFNAIAAAVLGGTSLFGGRGSVFPGTFIGAIMMQMITTGLVFTQVDLYFQPLVTAAIIFLAVFLDSMRNQQLEKMGRRNIRVESTA